MKPLEFVQPTSLAEAVRLLATQQAQTGLLSGGTDLIIQYRAGRRELLRMVDLKRIPELNVLEYDAKSGLRLGAAVSCAALGEFAPARAHYPGLVEGAELIGSTQIQSRATVGGNVCNGSPAADSICALIVLGAQCHVSGAGGQRVVPARDFMTGPGRTALQPGEVLVEIRVPAQAPRTSSAYERFIPRNEMDIAVASAAANVTLAADGKTVTAASVCIGAVAPTPLLVPDAAQAVQGKKLDAATLDAAARAASQAAQPISDVRGPAEYRRHLAAVLTRRVLQLAAQRAGQSVT
ncbi:MAG TPA: xanthine dehydrogenase family protein subunit M [bacterium]|nr:xanthine dehydrogenase family protein subunit M [bacterium]